MKAQLNQYRQSPRKVRLVTDLVKGKTVSRALAELQFLPKRASLSIGKLISSAAANAKNKDASLSKDDLIVKNIRVDKGLTLKRMRPRARGRAFLIRKRASRIQVELDTVNHSK
ncbi:MAG: 50S ribosomal protein L22 [Patescibacteria group bacterium]